MSAIRTRYFSPRSAAAVESVLTSVGLPISKMSATPDHRIWQVVLPTVRDADVLVQTLRSVDDAIDVIAWYVNAGDVYVTFGFLED